MDYYQNNYGNIKELQEINKTKLLTKKEKRDLNTKRKQYWHKIHPTGTKDGYLQSIKYETELQQLCKQRRRLLNISKAKDDMEFYILQRIKALHKDVIHKFPDDIKLRLDYLEFCLQINDVSQASLTISNLTKSHPNEPKVWHIAADWQLDEKKDINGALNILCKSFHYHNANEELFTKYFELELTFSKQFQIKQIFKKENSDEIVKEIAPKQDQLVEKAVILFEEAVKTIHNVYFYTNLIDIAAKYEFTLGLQKIIINHLSERFENEEITWHYLALAELNITATPGAGSEVAFMKSNPKIRYLNCIAKYKEGISRIGSERMWSYYLDTVMDIQLDNKTMPKFKISLLLKAFEDGHKEKIMKEKYYKQWLDFVPEDKKEEILEEGLKVLPKSEELWTEYLRSYILKDRQGSLSENITKVFRNAIKELEEESLPIWVMYLQYHMLTSPSNVIEQIFKEAIKQSAEVSQPLKVHYIDWLVITYGRDRAYEVYLLLANRKPFCKELHEKMALIESLEVKPNLKAWKNIHELACEQFGSEDTDAWIDYVKFDLRCMAGVHCSEIQEKALEHLPNRLKDVFNKLYNHLCSSAPKLYT